MKKIWFLAVAIFFVYTASAQQTEAYPSYIQVNGRAEMEVQPDSFTLSILLDEQDSKGKITVESQQKKMISALQKIGIDTKKSLKLDNLNTSYFKRKNSLAQAKYLLQLSSSEKVVLAWRTLDALGFSQVSLEKVSRSDLETLKREVRAKAMKNAQQTAEDLAGAVNQSIGKCFYVYDSNYDVTPRVYNRLYSGTRKMQADAEMAEEMSEEAPEFKTIKLTYQVQAKFELK